MDDKKIFIYLRLRDEKKILGKSRIREFAGISKLLMDFIKEIWQKYGLDTLKLGSLEYVDANSDMILISFREDIVRQQMIISGLLPKHYQARMLSEEEAKIKITPAEFAERMTSELDSGSQNAIKKRLEKPIPNVLSLIRENINENGEFYIALNNHPSPLEF